MKNIPFYLLSLLLICILTACSKNIPEPPEPPEEPMLTEATMEGRHTLSFLLDGEVWVSDRGLFDLSASIALNSKMLSVSSRKVDENREALTFSLVLENFEKGIYYLNQNDSNNILFARSQAIDGCAYDFDKIENDIFNIVDVTWIDNDNLHVAGTFQFRMIDQIEGCMDTIYITDGRFDLQFQTKP